MAVIRGVIRDHNGDWLFGFARIIGVCNVLMSELWAVSDALVHCFRLGWRKVVVETDNVTVADIFNRRSNALYESALVADIMEMLGRNWEVEIQHINQKTNIVANRLAALLRGSEMSDHLFRTPPKFILDCFNFDKDHVIT
ncbi:hypothetical protein like AT5G61090 [Hibiscus trionum]|uniref:RNase H type-1 domain-containing protein n=1 Tax=Hibiscus trionum TaxID=183268 RepID=A0A9W7M3B9_HIBTR|nr:hypothetical protein like AT5G61090 [Hibiscus trionum]